jgi:hypothetical protein
MNNKKARSIAAICALALAAPGLAAAAISSEEAVALAKKVASPFCSEDRQCVATARRARGHWAVTLQAVLRPAAVSPVLEAGHYRLVELDEAGNVLGIVQGK